MKKRMLVIMLTTLILCFITASFASAQGNKPFSTRPVENGNGKWRIGYYEGGSYTNYNKYLFSMVKGLIDLGWIDAVDIPKNIAGNSSKLWAWLAEDARSPYLDFVKNAHYSANWENDMRKRLSNRIIRRLNKKNDIDLMLAMGTWAGKDLANNKHNTNTMVISTSDPIGSGIIASAEDSGFDHIHARVDPFRYERQVRIFHDFVGFKRLGVAYEDSIVGRSYASIDMINKLAHERNFDVIECHTMSDIADQDVASRSVIECFENLVTQVDAIYVTVQGGVNQTSIPRLVDIANRHKVPTFSQYGSKEVRVGFLMSIARAGDFKPEGRFLAATAAQIFNGAKPRDLAQVFEESPNIALNLKTAEVIGYYLHADLLAAADEIYRNVD